MRRWMTAALLVAAVVGGVAAAGRSREPRWPPPSEVGSMARINATCRDYVGMAKPSVRDVIIAIGEDGNKLVAANPDLWVGVAAALCNFVDPKRAGEGTSSPAAW